MGVRMLKKGLIVLVGTLGTILTLSSCFETGHSLNSIEVTPANPSIITGATQQFVATGTYSNGDTQDFTSSVVWTSEAQTVATIDEKGLATGIDSGATTITASFGGVSGSTLLTVNISLESIAVTPVDPSIHTGETQQFTATGTYSDSSTQDLTSLVMWASEEEVVATINTHGLATSIVSGTSTITATLGLVSGSTILTVNKSVYIGGYSTNSSSVQVAGYWKDGVWNALTPLDATKNSSVQFITIFEGSVYAAGFSKNSSGTNIPGYWKDGVWNELPALDPAQDSSVWSMAFYDGSIYAGGFSINSSVILIPGYWKDGVWNGLTPLDATKSSVVWSTNIYDGNIYNSGYSINGSSVWVPGYWKDGVWNELPHNDVTKNYQVY